MREKLSRRIVVKGSLTGLAAAALAACAPSAPTPAPQKPAEAPKPAEPAKPAAPAPAATTAPAAAPAAAPTSAPAAAVPPAAAATKPAAAAAPTGFDAKVDKSLLGTLEGPTVITDPAQIPKDFKEAPQLADLVKAGKLPPVKERLPEEPLVIKPVKEIGKYGGTLNRSFLGASDEPSGSRLMNDTLAHWDYTGTKTVPNIIKGLQLSEDGKSTTLFLRKGLKWSDGAPFTAQDIQFWYDDLFMNKELTPAPSGFMVTASAVGVVKTVDPYTVRFEFADPHYMFPSMLNGSNGLGGQSHSRYPGSNGGGYQPFHYLKQFHPKYASKDELDAKVKEAKLDNWVNLFAQKSSWANNPEIPVMSPWKTAAGSGANTQTWTLERNPYFFAVDTAGNQLPYIDKIVMRAAQNLEVVNLQAINGEHDYAERNLDLAKVPLMLANQQKGNYKVYLDPGAYNDAVFQINQNFDADPELAKWLTTTDFRRALSLGINRDELNQVFWLGLGEPGSISPPESALFSPGNQYRTMWSTLDLAKANQMLDGLGLTKKDADGFRQRLDGKGRLRIEVLTYVGFIPFTKIGEMVREQWKKIGIELSVAETERGAFNTKVRASQHQMVLDVGWGAESLYVEPPTVEFPFSAAAPIGPKYGLWYSSLGKQGTEPPPRMKEIMAAFRDSLRAPPNQQAELAKKVWQIAVEEQWSIGTVGISPAIMGVRVVKNTMGNIPARMVNGSQTLNPMQSKPETYFFK